MVKLSFFCWHIDMTNKRWYFFNKIGGICQLLIVGYPFCRINLICRAFRKNKAYCYIKNWIIRSQLMSFNLISCFRLSIFNALVFQILLPSPRISFPVCSTEFYSTFWLQPRYDTHLLKKTLHLISIWKKAIITSVIV